MNKLDNKGTKGAKSKLVIEVEEDLPHIPSREVSAAKIAYDITHKKDLHHVNVMFDAYVNAAIDFREKYSNNNNTSALDVMRLILASLKDTLEMMPPNERVEAAKECAAGIIECVYAFHSDVPSKESKRN